jgi:biotin carboxylase
VALTVASERPSTFEAAQPANLLTLEFARPERAVERARRFAAEHPVAAVVGVDDDTVVLAAHLARGLGLPGHTVDAALAARDKQRQREILSAAGVPVPRFFPQSFSDDLRAVAARIPYPCVIKPLRLSASRGVIRADDPEGFAAAVARLAAILALPDAECGDAAGRFLVEEFISGPEVAIEGLVIDGTLRVLALFDKPDPLDGPFFEETIYVTPSRLPPAAQEAIAHCARDATRALGIRSGPVHAELRWNERGASLIELAARPIGGRCSAVLRFRDGSSLEEIVLRQAVGQSAPAPEREARAAGVMMIPVPAAGVLREICGLAEARAVPLVEDIEITAHAGERLVPLPEGARYPGFIFARGDSPAAVEAALRAAHARLRFVVEPA